VWVCKYIKVSLSVMPGVVWVERKRGHVFLGKIVILFITKFRLHLQFALVLSSKTVDKQQRNLRLDHMNHSQPRYIATTRKTSNGLLTPLSLLKCDVGCFYVYNDV